MTNIGDFYLELRPVKLPRQALKSASNDAISVLQHGSKIMRTTIALDDELLALAQEYTGLKEKSALVHEALKALVAREAGRRLALLGGSDPDAVAAPRRRFPPE